MKKYLFLFVSIFSLIIACSKEEEVVTPPAPNKYTLTISAETGGTVSTEGGLYNEGSKITVTATPDGMYLFKEWSDGSTQNPREITVTSNLTLKASFIKKTYPLAVTVEGEGTVAEEVIIQGSTSETTYNAGTTVRLTATPNEGWVFAGWSGDVESNETMIEILITKGIFIEASFRNAPEEFLIHNTSFETHEFNNGYYNSHFISLPGDPNFAVGLTYVDFNKDGYFDILGKDERDPSVLTLYTNDGYNNYVHSIIPSENGFPLDNVGPRKVITADINNDGELDIIVGLAPDDFENPRGVYIYENKGLGERFYRHNITTGDHDWIHAITAGDINNDGYIDIYAGGLGYVFFGNGDFTFNTKPLPNYFTTVNAPVSSELFDINEDGLLDLLIGYHKGSYDPSATWGVFGNSHVIHYGTGDDSMFTEPYILDSAYEGTNITLDFTVLDFDDDGDYDLFTNSSFDYQSKFVLQYYENNGYMNFINRSAEVFENECNLILNFGDPDWIKFVDMNNDGTKELMIEHGLFDKSQDVDNDGQIDWIKANFMGFELNERGRFERRWYQN
jgi:hypothetical protein